MGKSIEVPFRLTVYIGYQPALSHVASPQTRTFSLLISVVLVHGKSVTDVV